MLDVGPLGLSVSRETVEKLDHFVDLFEKWSASINLVANSTRDQIWSRHVGDSLQLTVLHPMPAHWIDLGSGGGFPGVITAILLADTGQGWVDLIESNQKKASFLRLALAETGARGHVHACRIEDSYVAVPKVDAVSARALADLDKLLEISMPWLSGADAAAAWFHKGREYLREVENARSRWEFDLVEHRSQINDESVILEISNVSRRPI